MNTVLVAGMLAAQLAVADVERDSPLKVNEQVIRQAVRAILAEDAAGRVKRRHEADTVRADKYEVFGQQFDEAKVPDCLHPDALKRQPPAIGPIGFVGLYAVPFVLLAKLRGKCL